MEPLNKRNNGSTISMRSLFKSKRQSSSRSSRDSGSNDSSDGLGRQSTVSTPSSVGESMAEAVVRAKKRRGEEKLTGRRREVFDASLEDVSRKGTLISRMMNFNITVVKKDASQEQLIREALQRNIVLSDLSEKDLNTVIGAMKFKKVPAKTVLITQGDNGDNFYVVQKGRFFFRKDGENVGEALPGESFGELALLYNVSRAVSVIAAEESTVWSLDRATFRSIMITSNYKKTQIIKESLMRIPLFSGFSVEQLEKLAESVELVNFKKDTVIIQKGTTGSVIYFLKSGAVKIKNIGESSGNTVDLILDKEGDHFGERSLMTDEPRAADVIAHTDCEIFILDKESFETILGPIKQVLEQNLALNVLKSVPILHELSEEKLKGLLKEIKKEEFAPNDIIIQQGAIGKKFYILEKGKVEILKHTKGSNNAPETTVKITELQIGDYFGEGSMLKNSPTNAEVRALTPVIVFSLDHTAFRAFLDPVHAKIEKEFKVREKETDDELSKKVNAIESGIAFSDLRLLQVLGRGTFGVVKMVEHKSWKTTYALKILQKEQIVKFRQQKNVMNEKNVMLKARHPFILKLYKTFKDQNCLYMLLELIQGGELFSLLRISGGRISGRRARFYASCVLDALVYLHNMEIIYRDLKPENLLIDAQGYIRVVDFGFAKKVTGKTYTLCGTPEYLAPELVTQKGHDKAIDYWALGVLIYEMLEGRSPFTDPSQQPEDEQEYQKIIFNNIVRGHYEFTERFSSAAKSLVKGLLRPKSQERAGMGPSGGEEIRSHKWFGKTDWEGLLKKKLEAPWIPEILGPTDTTYFDEDEENDEVHVMPYSGKPEDEWDRDF